MGAWATDNLSNDTALDWIGAFLERPSQKLLEKTLTKKQVESWDNEEALAAAEIVALLRGHPASEASYDLKFWGQRCKWVLKEEIKESAIAIVSRISEKSELLDLYRESQLENEWKIVLNDLLLRLKAKPRTMPKLAKPPKFIEINNQKIYLDDSFTVSNVLPVDSGYFAEISIDKSWSDKHLVKAVDIMMDLVPLYLELTIFETSKKLPKERLSEVLKALCLNLRGLKIPICGANLLDPSVFSEAENLEHLSFRLSHEHHIDFVSSLNNLETLVLKDISPLQSLEVIPFETLRRLKRVRIENPPGNPLDQKNPVLPTFPSWLEELYLCIGLYYDVVADYQCLSRLLSLRALTLSDPSLLELPSFNKFFLESFILIYTPKLKDLSRLAEAHRLLDLGLYSSNEVQDFTFLGQLHTLKELYLSDAKTASPWEALAALSKLEKCSLINVPTTTEFPQLPELRYLKLHKVKIRNLDSLKHLTGLLELDLWQVECENFSIDTLKRLPNLSALSIRELKVQGVDSTNNLNLPLCKADFWPEYRPSLYNPWKSDWN